MQKQSQTTKSPAEREMTIEIVNDDATIRQAQQLRFDVFSLEFNAGFGEKLIDTDEFDAYCKHLVVIDCVTGAVVATCRILTQDKLAAIGRFYSETEFILSDAIRQESKIMEIGRTCIHPDYRHGSVLSMLWMGITKYLLQNDFRYLIGCGSISIRDGGQQAWKVSQYLKRTYPAADQFSVTPKRQMPHLTSQATTTVTNDEIPSLLRAYMRLGAKVCGDPCWDPAFKTADVFIMLDAKEMPSRYKRRFLKEPPRARSL